MSDLTCETGDAQCAASHVESQPSSDDWWTPYLVFVLFTSLVLLPLLPWFLHRNDILKTENLGRLLSVRYVGGFGTNTQIDVSTQQGTDPSAQEHSYLLQGIAILAPQAELVLQQGHGSTRICIQHTEQCWPLLGN